MEGRTHSQCDVCSQANMTSTRGCEEMDSAGPPVAKRGRKRGKGRGDGKREIPGDRGFAASSRNDPGDTRCVVFSVPPSQATWQ